MESMNLKVNGRTIWFNEIRVLQGNGMTNADLVAKWMTHEPPFLTWAMSDVAMGWDPRISDPEGVVVDNRFLVFLAKLRVWVAVINASPEEQQAIIDNQHPDNAGIEVNWK